MSDSSSVTRDFPLIASVKMSAEKLAEFIALLQDLYSYDEVGHLTEELRKKIDTYFPEESIKKLVLPTKIREILIRNCGFIIVSQIRRTPNDQLLEFMTYQQMHTVRAAVPFQAQ